MNTVDTLQDLTHHNNMTLLSSFTQIKEHLSPEWFREYTQLQPTVHWSQRADHGGCEGEREGQTTNLRHKDTRQPSKTANMFLINITLKKLFPILQKLQINCKSHSYKKRLRPQTNVDQRTITASAGHSRSFQKSRYQRFIFEHPYIFDQLLPD